MSDTTWKVMRANYKTVWQEDDCAYDAESICEAWERMFGKKLDLSQSLNKIDGGDATAHIMPDGRIAITSYRGNAEILILNPYWSKR